MGNVKSLAGDTIIYGVSTILGRLLNWLLFPLYLRTLSIPDNGILTYLYAIVAIVQIIMSFGFETSFFRFAKTHGMKVVFSTLFSFTLVFSVLFLVLILFNSELVSSLIDLPGKSELIIYVAGILVFDAIANLPFSILRYESKSLKYAFLRFTQIIVIVSFNLFFLILLPYLLQKFNHIDLYNMISRNGLNYVFLSNLIGSFFVLLFLYRETLDNFVRPDFKLFKIIWHYSLPILLVGIFGMINLNADKLILPHIVDDVDNFKQLGIYGANFKIGVLMALFTQSFRLAFEPFFFKNSHESNIQKTYADVLKYFVAFGMIIFLGVTLFMDVINLLLTKDYLEGNSVIPFVLLGQLFFGVYYSLSLWYKLTDKTWLGMYFTLIGLVITLVGNVVLVPVFGYIGAAVTGFLSYFSMALISYFIGQRHYPVPYDVKIIIIYILSGLIIYFVNYYINFELLFFELSFNFLLFSIFFLVLYYKEIQFFKSKFFNQSNL